MKYLALTFLLLASLAQGQYTMGYGGSATGSFTIGYGNGGGLPGVAQLPLYWADDRECNPPGGVFDVTKVMGVDYPGNATGTQLALNDWYAAPDQWRAIQIPLSTFGTLSPLIINSLVTLPGKANATKCLVIMGTGSLTLIPNQTLCSHLTRDNFDGSSPRNLGCTNDIGKIATIEGQWTPGNNGQLFQACTIGGTNCPVGPNHIAFKNLELRPKAGTDYGSFKLINLDDGDTLGTRGSNHIGFLQNYIHADATDAGTATNRVASGIDYTSCSNCWAVFNYFDKVLSLGSESHVVTMTWVPGPFKFNDNWVEGSSIPFFTGGAGSTVLPNENVYDVEIRRNRFTHPPAWMPMSGAIAIKSSGELKTCTRCLIDGNIFENANASGGQKGQCFTFTPRNTSGGAMGENYANSIDNITFTNNVCRHAVSGIETSGRSGGAGNGGGAALPLRLLNVTNNLFYDLSPGTATIFNNTVNIPFIVEVGGGGNSWTTTNAVRDPSGTFITLTLADGGPGLHKTTMSVGDLVQVQGCTDLTFRTPTHDGAFFAEGPVALAGTLSFVTVAGNPVPGPVIYANAGTPNATTTGCIVSNAQGFQQGFTVRHNTVIGGFFGASGGKGQVPSCGAIDTYAQKYTFQDNLIAPLPTQYGGAVCQGDGYTEGTKSEGGMADLATFVFNHNALVGRTASSYTDYPGAVTPSVANWYPANASCAGSTADSSCFGFSGMMSGATYLANAPTIDGYALVPTSLYVAGGSRQASDGGQVGADISAIKAAQLATQYVCNTPCGIAGPNPD